MERCRLRGCILQGGEEPGAGALIGADPDLPGAAGLPVQRTH
jgi:hypothetical protein